MKLIVNRATTKVKNKTQINLSYDQNSISILQEIMTKSDSHQMKPKQNKIKYTSNEKIWDLSSMHLGNRSTKKRKNVRNSKWVVSLDTK